jgi:glycosyltransferase involved in cell wall biosynthesis
MTPLVIFCYNRPQMLEEVVKAVNAQTVKPPLVRVYVDGPQSTADRKSIKDCVQVANGLRCSKNIIENFVNLGCAMSIMRGVNSSLASYESVVVLEDDVVPSPHWYEAMTALLNRYKDDPLVGAVGAFPSLLNGALPGYEHDVVFSSRFCPWGWGAWADKWNTVHTDWESYRSHHLPWDLADMPNEAGGDIAQLIANHPHGKLWDGMVVGSFLMRNLKQACTRHYMVKNIGAGIHLDVSRLAFMYSQNPIEDKIPAKLPNLSDVSTSQIMAAVRSYVTKMS